MRIENGKEDFMMMLNFMCGTIWGIERSSYTHRKGK